jgi:hypothetical protein
LIGGFTWQIHDSGILPFDKETVHIVPDSAAVAGSEESSVPSIMMANGLDSEVVGV